MLSIKVEQFVPNFARELHEENMMISSFQLFLSLDTSSINNSIPSKDSVNCVRLFLMANREMKKCHGIKI